MSRRTLAIGATVTAIAASAVPALGHDTATTTTPSPDRVAGTVSSFSDGTLTIALDAGGTLTGQVVNRTRVICRSGEGSSPTDATQPAAPPTTSENTARHVRRHLRRHVRRHVRRQVRHHVRERRCTANQLQAGTPVRRATLIAAPGGSAFASVLLIRDDG